MNYSLLNMLAEAAATGADVAAAGTEEIGAGAQFIIMLVNILPMIIIFAVFYFFLIRPQRKKDKEAQQMLKNLKVGDRVCTIGGFYGTIVRIKDDVLTIECGDAKTQMKIARWAVKNIDTLSISNDAETLI